MAGKRHRQYNADDVKFVHENYLKMTATEIAGKLGISKFQVSKVVSELRKYIDLPKKTVRRENPIVKYLKSKGLSSEQKKKEARKK
jgi:DNA-binding transcriptional regulator GbsR (MarR family)